MGYKKPEIKSYSASDALEQIGPCQNQYGRNGGTQEYTTTLYTISGDSGRNIDGAIVTPSEIVVSTLELGDFTNVAYYTRGFVGFDISSIQGTVVSATLRVYQVLGSWQGTPYVDLAPLVVDHVDFGNTLEHDNDFSGGTLTSSIGNISTNDTIEWKTLDVTSYVQADLNAGRTSSQFRLRFFTDNDGENDSDQSYFENAENDGGTGYRPELVVTYRY